MKAKPILFNGDMVRALLDGRKTQTRRVIKPQPTVADGRTELRGSRGRSSNVPTGQEQSFDWMALWEKGDLLWVRETFASRYFDDGDHGYRADWNVSTIVPEPKWTPSIHMPRTASRLTLRIKDVRVERVQDISENDALAEGVFTGPPDDDGWVSLSHKPGGGKYSDGEAKHAFRSLWRSVNKPGRGWESNPWVWVVEFEVLHGNVDEFLKGEK